MAELFQYQSISSQLLTHNSNWDIHPYLPEDHPIFQSCDSISRLGLLYSPLVQPAQDGIYTTITGGRCINYLKSINPETEIYCHCRIIAEDIDPKQLLLLVYDEYSRSKALTAIELAHFVQICIRHLNKSEQQQIFESSCLNTKVYNNRLLEFLSLEYPLQAGMLHGVLTENIARELLHCNPADRISIYSLFTYLNVGGGKQKRFLNFLRDLAGREGHSIKNIIEKKEFQDVLHHQEMNIPQKSQTLLRLLQEYHSPSLHKAENHFNTWRNGLNLPTNCTVSHSDSFENDQITLAIRFGTQQEFENCWRALKHHL
jgi:hypothetical protein